MAQRVKYLPAMSQVQSPGQEDLLEKEMAIHSSTLAWKIPWMKEPGRLQSMGLQREMTERLHFHFQDANSDPSDAEPELLTTEIYGLRELVGREPNLPVLCEAHTPPVPLLTRHAV